MNILKLNGEDSELYTLVAHLVMNKEVIAGNNNYPFKTSPSYTWFVACDEEDKTVGFMPVELKGRKATINNYYVEDDEPDIFKPLLQSLTEQLNDRYAILAVVHNKHVNIFKRQHFEVMFEWEKYVKMLYSQPDD